MSLDTTATLKEVLDTFDLINTKLIDRGGAKTITPSTTNQVLSKGNYKGDITIKGDANLIASNIIKGKSIFDIIGGLEPEKREASGSVYTSSGWGIINVRNLPFKPRVVVVTGYHAACYGISILRGDIGATLNNGALTAGNGSTTTFRGLGTAYAMLYDDGFQTALYRDGAGNIHWWAIE